MARWLATKGQHSERCHDLHLVVAGAQQSRLGANNCLSLRKVSFAEVTG